MGPAARRFTLYPTLADPPPPPAVLPPQPAALHRRPPRPWRPGFPQRLPGRAGQPHSRQSSAPHGRLHGLRDLPAALHRTDHRVRRSRFLLSSDSLKSLSLNVTRLSSPCAPAELLAAMSPVRPAGEQISPPYRSWSCL